MPEPQFALGGHPLSLLDQTDLLLLSGGVSPAIPIAEEARRRGIPLTNDGALTLRHCPAPVVGITGSAGKTTTTTLTGLILERAGYRVHVGETSARRSSTGWPRFSGATRWSWSCRASSSS